MQLYGRMCFFAGVGAVDDNGGVSQWPKVYFLTQFQECQLNEVLQIDEVVHVDLFLTQSPDEGIYLLHPIKEFLVLLEVLLKQVNQLLEVLLAAFEEDEGAVLREVVFQYVFEGDALLPEVDVKGDFKGFFTCLTVYESPYTALQDLLLIFLLVASYIYFFLEDEQYFVVVEFVHVLHWGYAIDILVFLPAAVDDIFLMEAQVPERGLELSELVLVCVVEAEARVLLLDHCQFQEGVLHDVFQPAQEGSVQLEVYSPPDLVLQSEFAVDVLESDGFVAGRLMSEVVAVEGEVVEAVLLALGRLAVGWEELDAAVVPEFLDVVHVGALLPFLLAVAGHVEPADEALVEVFGQSLHPLLLALAHDALVVVAVLADGLDALRHVGGGVLDEVDAAGSEGRHDDVDLCVALDVGQVADEVSELAEGLCLFEADLAEPGAEHADGVVDVGTEGLQEGDELVPLLAVHNLPDPAPHPLVLVDLAHAQRRAARLLVALRELEGVQPEVVQVFDEEEGALMEVRLLQEEPLLRLLLPQRPVEDRHLEVLLALQVQLLEAVGEPAVLGLHDAEASEVEAAVGGLLGWRVLLQVLEQFGDVVRVGELDDCVLGGKIFLVLGQLHADIKEYYSDIKERDMGEAGRGKILTDDGNNGYADGF